MSICSIDSRLSKIYVCAHDQILDNLVDGRRVIVITDTNIYANYRDFIERYSYLVIEDGEGVKTLDTVGNIYEELINMQADRNTLLLGIGGGVITDITGFVAATYMRGIKFGFISTSLLGQVDASVGGKNGVNVNDFKNMVGTFTHPEFVILDVDMLKTLPARELRAGMAEVVKAAIIGDKSLFEDIESRDIEQIYGDRAFMIDMVTRALRVKLAIVEQDERESGLRRLLNLGHTVGHAIEKCTHEYNHGEAVAIGMVMIARAAVRRAMLKCSECKRIESVLEKLGFCLYTDVSLRDIIYAIVQDKKRCGSTINLIVPCEIGRCEVVPVDYNELELLL